MNVFDRTVAELYLAAGVETWGIALCRVTADFDGFDRQLAIDNQTRARTYSGSFGPIPAESELEFVKTSLRVDSRLPMLLKRVLGD